MIDYEILKVIWWLFVGVLLVGFAVMDGQDMGVGSLLPFLGKNDTERRIMINSVAPHWDGNQVWLLTGGGAIFAAWPLVYATAFSGLYWALFIVLSALILRPVAFDYRSRVSAQKWRSSWDWALFIGSAVPPIIFGVAFGNMLQGVPFHFDETLRSTYTGSFWALLNPFGLLCGVVSIVMTVFHGANYLLLRTTGQLQARARRVGIVAGALTALLFAVSGLWVYVGITGYVAGNVNPAGVANPLLKTVTTAEGAWFTNFMNYPALFAVPALAILAAILGVLCQYVWKPMAAVLSSSLSIACIVLTPLVAMFPFILPSSSHPVSSLTMWDCTSSQLTLQVMFIVTLIFLPIVLIYTSWAYKVMSGKLTASYIKENDKSLY
ncbi:MAG: cytochrome d ubiquinol oxidase subunit II [Candidatus Aphodousia sp.]|nr:cytochrome d ubiquinol oxidase subunit II [Sutterella sp.]MDY2898939.1 cytochrome d ubiquinol oxidase subunit II [Candidatus Aphodousia sp.]